jgi:hypothetical protein
MYGNFLSRSKICLNAQMSWDEVMTANNFWAGCDGMPSEGSVRSRLLANERRTVLVRARIRVRVRPLGASVTTRGIPRVKICLPWRSEHQCC